MSPVLSAARRFLGRPDRDQDRDDPSTHQAAALPDPSKPPGNRGEWGRAAILNVDITEQVKTQIGTRTLPWQK